MSEATQASFMNCRQTVAVACSALLLGGCFAPRPQAPRPEPSPTGPLVERVAAALDGREDAALTYAGLYDVLAGRFESRAYATTTQAAAVAGRAAEIIGTPGVLDEVVNDELNPLLGTPRAITPEIAARAAAKLRDLSAAYREVVQ